MARVCAAVFCLGSLAVVSAQSAFGFPGHRYPFSGFDPLVNTRSYNRYAHAFEEPFLPPCPKYRPMELGEWQEVVTPPGGAYQMHAELPWVRPSDRRAQISPDGLSIDILGLRQVPARGRMRAPECLPRGAKLSRDGMFEILEASVPVPPGDVSLATVRQTRHGLDIIVPLRQHLRPANTPKTDQKGQKDQSVDQGVDQSVRGHGFHRGQRPDQGDVATQPKPRKASATSEVPKESKVSLPPSDGIEIVEEEYEYPEKDADASEGWVDIRGEFQSY
mmetsp:Transcript_5162/g.8713  ORF Transcript_5162/g.8713 Transcript_5162/m.8713 type:complete len:276 (+) Transcript_5162:62-889(+)